MSTTLHSFMDIFETTIEDEVIFLYILAGR